MLDGFIGALFETVAVHVPPPQGLASPMRWGSEEHLAALFGADVEWSLRRSRGFRAQFRRASRR